MTKFPVNLDANASYPVLPKIWQALAEERPDLNPSSVHRGGQQARAMLENARESLRKLLGLDKSWTLVFTSGASEANNTALMLPLWRKFENHDSNSISVVSSALEHPSVREPLQRLSKYGVKVKWVAPEKDASLSAHDFLQAIESETCMISCMLANNETGQILPVAEIVSKVKELRPEILFHCDAVQALGKFKLDYSALGVDLLTFSAHKIGALSGAGLLAIRAASDLPPLLLGGPQEQRLRAGTENLAAIYTFGLAAEELKASLTERIGRMNTARETIKTCLKEQIQNLRVNFENQKTLLNTLSITLDGISADDLVVAADLEGVYISAGSACASGKPEPSASLLAQGFSEQEAKSTIRISVSAELELSQAQHAAEVLSKCIKRARGH